MPAARRSILRRNSLRGIRKSVWPKLLKNNEKTKLEVKQCSGLRSANTGGTVAPEMHGCSYKTFTNGKPHSFNGTEGVVGLKRWFEKMEQVFEICKCAEDDKVKMEQELLDFDLKGDDIEAYNESLHKLFDVSLRLQFDRAEILEVVAEANQVHDIDRSDPDVLRYHALQNRSFYVAEVRKNMCMHLKNQGVYKQSHFKGMSYADIRLIFKRVWDQNHAFVPKDSEIEKEVMKIPGFDFLQKPIKKNDKIKASSFI
ncbi:hypothetical protein Tco_0979524 [Tanacetum coccineum]